jgi:hypothetical protein
VLLALPNAQLVMDQLQTVLAVFKDQSLSTELVQFLAVKINSASRESVLIALPAVMDASTLLRTVFNAHQDM